jgi:hypothetical protein
VGQSSGCFGLATLLICRQKKLQMGIFHRRHEKLLARAPLAKAPAATTASPQAKAKTSYFSDEEMDGASVPQFSYSLAGVRMLAEGEDNGNRAFADRRIIKPRPLPFPIQAKLMVGAVNDPLEQEADRVAEQVMRMPEPRTTSAPTNSVTAGFGSGAAASSASASVSGSVAGVQRKCDCGGSCDDCKKKHSDEAHAKVQMKASAPGVTGGFEAPAIVHDVLRSPGQPLDASTRAFMEPRFGHDFSKVRIHTDAKAAESARVLGARAYTMGQNLVFGAREYGPGTLDGKRLLGHELAHVVQQHNQKGDAANEEGLEQEADLAVRNLLAGRTLNLRLHASADMTHYKRLKDHGKEYEIGDIVLNAAAQDDVMQFGELTPNDQSHLFVDGNKLGYEVGFNKPKDPFRWNQIKSIVDKEHINIKSIANTDMFDSSLVEPPNPSKKVKLSLIALKAGGITLPTLSRQQTIDPGAKSYQCSADSARDEIYYETGGGAKNPSSSSLAHELFGHFGLALKGAAWQHGQSIPASQGVTDPFGQPFVGDVDDYISGFANNEPRGPFRTPTAFVSPEFLKQFLADLAANKGKGLKRLKGDGLDVSADFQTIWLHLTQNYRALGVTEKQAAKAAAGAQQGSGAGSASVPPASTTPSTAVASIPTRTDIETAVLNWFGGLNADQQWAFREYLSGFHVPAGQSELGNAIWAKLSKP